MESITIPYAAINNPIFGISPYNGQYYNPFYGCTRLIAISAALNMTVVEYFRHVAQIKEDRVRLRVWVLICLKRIDDKRISDREDAKRRKLNGGGRNSSSRSSSSSSSNVVLRRSSGIKGSSSRSSQQPQGQEFKGVLAESKITAFEMWREIVTFL